MAELLRMPSVAAGTDEGKLSEWSVPENQPFAAAEVIAVIETEKAVVDVQAEMAGVVIKWLVPPGTDVQVGEAIALVGQPGETVSDINAVLASLGASAAHGGSGSTVPVVDVPTRASEPEAKDTDSVNADRPRGSGGRRFTSPIARRLASEAGLSVTDVTGTGPGGRIVRADVERAIATPPPANPAAPAPAVAATEPGTVTPAAVTPAAVAPPAVASAPTPTVAYSGAKSVPHSRARRAIAQRLTLSKQTIPHFYLRGSAQVDRMLALRTELNDGAAVKVSVNDLIVKATARAHQLVPAMNVLWTPDAMLHPSGVDLAMAVATDGGLVTPVLRGVETMTVTAVASTTRDFAIRAREGHLRQMELEGGVSTITNLGTSGTEEFAAIINPPQSSILAVGAATAAPVVDKKGKLSVGSLMRVTLSVDHRPIDGSTAAEWMQAFVALLEAPLQILV